MLLESVWNFHDDETNAVWAITGDEWSPMFIDTEITSPRFNKTGEVWLWVLVYAGTQAALYANGDEIYQFILRSSATNDATNLNGTIRDHVLSPAYTFTGAGTGDTRLVASSRPLAFALSGDDFLRYIQLYCQTTGTVGSCGLQVYCGLAASKSAIPSRKYLQTIVTNVVAPT